MGIVDSRYSSSDGTREGVAFSDSASGGKDRMARPKILFLMSQYPDIDHLVPIADLVAETGNYDVEILAYQKRVDFEKDPRIRYLKETHGIGTRIMDDYYPISSSLPWKLYEWRSYWGKKCKDTAPFSVMGRNLKSLFMPRFHIFRLSRFLVDRILAFWLGNKTWGERLLEETKPSVVVSDHAFATYWISSFLRQVKSARIPTIAFPHSSFMFSHTHVLKNEKGVPLETTNEEEFPWDCIVVESGMRITLLKELGIPLRRMFALGCIRFTNWWLNRSPHEKDIALALRKDERPTVLYLASNPDVTLEEGIDRLREAMVRYMDRIRFIVKVHSRRERTELFKSFSDVGIEVKGNEISSPELINEAHYILLTATSIIIDAILKEKPIVFLQFTTDNEPLFHKYRAFPAVRSGEELEVILGKMAKKEWEPELRLEARKSYLRECVYGGLEDEEDLLKGCLEIFLQAVKSRSSDDFSEWVGTVGSRSLSRLM